MSKFYDALNDKHVAFIKAQKMFFVGTAPLADAGRVNLSPKGYDSFRVIGPRWRMRTWAARASRRLRISGRTGILHVLPYEGPANIMRLYGRGSVMQFNPIRALPRRSRSSRRAMSGRGRSSLPISSRCRTAVAGLCRSTSSRASAISCSAISRTVRWKNGMSVASSGARKEKTQMWPAGHDPAEGCGVGHMMRTLVSLGVIPLGLGGCVITHETRVVGDAGCDRAGLMRRRRRSTPNTSSFRRAMRRSGCRGSCPMRTLRGRLWRYGSAIGERVREDRGSAEGCRRERGGSCGDDGLSGCADAGRLHGFRRHDARLWPPLWQRCTA